MEQNQAPTTKIKTRMDSENRINNPIQIKYSTRVSGNIYLRILKQDGTLLSDLVQEPKPRGSYITSFNATNTLPGAGVYILAMQLNGQEFTQLMKIT